MMDYMAMRDATFYASRMGRLQAKLETLTIYLSETTDPTLARVRDEARAMLLSMDAEDRRYLEAQGVTTMTQSNAWLLSLDGQRSEPVGLTE